MNPQKEFSQVTQSYLSCFGQILDDMICNMTDAELTDSISHNFIVQMIPHHMAAIQMSENLLQYTTCIPLQNIATDIISSQTKSIEHMTEVLNPCSRLRNTDQECCLYLQRFDQITHTMFSGMRCAVSTNNINANFMREMIPHHEGAIRMSRNALRFPVCRELVPILQAIITSQEAGVRKMECLLRCI